MMTNPPPLWEHQRNAIEFAQSHPHVGLFFEMGTGKTRCAIDILRHRCAAKGRLLKTVILAPRIVCPNWATEIERYSRIAREDVLVLLGPLKRRIKQFDEAVLEDLQYKRAKIIVTNYEAMENEEFFNRLIDWEVEVIIADEAHRIKNPEAVRAKRVVKLSDRKSVAYKYALTGTPILNSAMDIFNIFRFLDGGATFGVNFWSFRQTWFEDENARWAGNQGYFPKWAPRPEAYEQFSDMIYRKALRAKKSECLDLPPFVRKEVNVEMSPEQARMYREMRDEYIAYVDDITKTDTPRAVVAQLAVVKAQRLMQILTGYAKTEEGEIVKIEKNPRLDALGELLEDLQGEHKIIVWSIYHENYSDIRKLCQKLKIDFVELHGQVKDRDKQPAIERFNNDPKCRVMIANQGAGGIGVNLTASDVSIYYSKNYSLEHDQQSEARNYRGGSEIHQNVTRIDITVKDTIDELIGDALENKQKISDKILDWKELI